MYQYCTPDFAPGRTTGRSEPELTGSDAPDQRPGILVVDDEPLVRKLLERALELEGFRVWPAADGGQALTLYRDRGQEIAVVLLDVRMPGLDGLQTLSALQQLNPDVCCCLMSGHTGNYDHSELLKHGAAHVFPKPFSLKVMATQLWQLTNSRPGRPVRPGPADHRE